MDSDPFNSVLLLVTSIEVEKLTFGIALAIVVMLLLFFISGLVSGSEVAYFSLSPGEIAKLKATDNRFSRMVLYHLQAPERLLATILITNNFVNVAIVVISTFITQSLFVFSGPVWVAFVIQIVVVTFLILFFSEIFPKIYANRFSITFALLTAPSLKFFSKLFWPVSSFLIYSTSIVNKKLAKHSGNISFDELSDALELTEKHLAEEKNILKGIIKFGNIDVCDIMKSRVDIVAADINSNFKELLTLINNSGYSRIPVFQDTFDTIKGILYVKDLLPYVNKPKTFKWQSLIRPSYFVPESKKINDLLKEFQTNRIHLAVVVDEYGGTSGIVTLEDILEEIIGEIIDESDEETPPFEKIDNSNFIFEGKTLLNDFYKIIEVSDTIFDEVKGEADTLAGLILELREEFPAKGDKLAYKNFVFEILSVDKRRIKKVKVNIRSSINK